MHKSCVQPAASKVKVSSWIPLIAFCLLGVVWGSCFIYMKMAVHYISPVQIVFFRVLFGVIPVAVLAYSRGALKLAHLRHAGHFLVMGILATALYFCAFAKGTSLLLSGVAGAVSGAVPLFSFVLALIFIAEEKATRTRLLGIFVGFVGVIAIARPSGSDLSTTSMEGVLYMLAGSLSVGSSFVYARKFIIPLRIPAVALATYQLTIGLLLLTLFTSFEGIGVIFEDTGAAIALIVGLGLLGTGFAYIIYYYLVDTMGAVSASAVTYVPPVVALLIGSLIVSEPIAVFDYLATGLIFLGVFLLKKTPG